MPILAGHGFLGAGNAIWSWNFRAHGAGNIENLVSEIQLPLFSMNWMKTMPK